MGVYVLLRICPAHRVNAKNGREVPKCIRACNSKSVIVSKDPNLLEVADTKAAEEALGPLISKRYNFDRVFTPHHAQGQIYSSSIRSRVKSAFEGGKFCVIAYGQSGSGKSYSLCGGEQAEQRGLIPRVIEGRFFSFFLIMSPSSTLT